MSKKHFSKSSPPTPEKTIPVNGCELNLERNRITVTEKEIRDGEFNCRSYGWTGLETIDEKISCLNPRCRYRELE